MSTKRKILVGFVVVLVMTIVGWGLLAAAVYASGGVVTVKVDNRDEGIRFTVPVPSVIVSAAVATADQFVPEEEMMQIQAQIGDWGPYVEGLLEALVETPDAVLVEVFDHGEHVVVRKSGGLLKVEVNGADISVQVSIPARLVKRTVGTLIS
jgi:hypothetical protein